MSVDFREYFIYEHFSIRKVLEKLNELAPNSIGFLVDEEHHLLGSVTDGDMRRGFINGLDFNSSIADFLQPKPFRLKRVELTPGNHRRLKENRIRIVPIVDDNDVIVDVINIENYKSLLPLDALIMAGGEGRRLRPMTLTTPKPLLRIGPKPIMEYNVELLCKYGVRDFAISVRYLADQIRNYFQDGKKWSVNISYVQEDEPLGTLGALKLLPEFKHDHILVMNSDLLTNIDFEDMFSELVKADGDMIVATIPYKVNIPYGVVETNGIHIESLKEKPTYTYYSNAGIYILKTEHAGLIEKDVPFNATDMMEKLIAMKKKVMHYPMLGYWLDIGKPEDFEKAQHDIKHINF